MTMKETEKFLHKKADYLTNGMHVVVTIEDCRYVYSRLQFKITPVSGYGSTWVDFASVVVQEG